MNPRATITRRRFARLATAGGLGALGILALAGCGESQVVTETKIERVTVEVPVEKVVTQIVEKEKVVEKSVEKIVTQIVEKEKIVEKIVTVPATVAKPQAIQLVHSTWWGLESGGFGLFEQKYIDLYQTLRPHVTIEYRNWPWAEYHTKLLTQAAAGTNPDTFAHSNVFYPKLVKRGGALPLDEWVKAHPEFEIEDFIPVALHLSTIGGKLYGFPHISSSWGVIYNTKVFEEAGVEDLNALNEANKFDWDSELEILQKITKRDAGGKIERLGMGNPGMNFRDVSPWVHQNGGEVLKQPTLDEFVLNEPAGAEAIQWMADLVFKHKVAASPADYLVSGGADLNNGRLGTLMTWANFTNFKGFPIDFAYPPKRKNRMTIVHTNSLGVSAKTKYPDEAAEYIAMQSSKTGDRDQADFGMGIVLRETNLDHLTQINKTTFGVAHAEVVVEVIRTGRVYDINEFHQESIDATQPVLDEIQNGAPAQQKLDELKPVMDKILAPMKA